MLYHEIKLWINCTLIVIVAVINMAFTSQRVERASGSGVIFSTEAMISYFS